jgi:hypothetical protein
MESSVPGRLYLYGKQCACVPAVACTYMESSVPGRLYLYGKQCAR